MGRMNFVMAAALVLAACSDSDTTTDDTGTTGGMQQDAPEVVGSYVDDFMGTHVITADTWTSGTLVFHIETVDNAADYLIAENDAANEFNPSLWSRFDWHDEAGQLYFCQSVFDGASADAAAMGSADGSDLMMGCGGFGWSMLTPE